LSNFTLSPTVPAHPTLAPTVAVSAATGNFFDRKATYAHTSLPLINVKPVSQGITVLLPNKATMMSTHEAELDIPLLPAHAKKVHIFPELASGSLLSIGQLCDGGCTATFTASKLYIYLHGKIIIQGTQQHNKLWTIDPPSPPSCHHSLNAAIDTPTIAERIKF
jgi:hypothetical protein